MVTELQFAGVAAYLLWCLFSSLTGVFGSDLEGTATDSKINESDKKEEIPTVG